MSAPHSSTRSQSFAHHQPPHGPPFAGKPPPVANSRTFKHATASSASILDGGARNGPHTQVQILDSGGAALESADRALFGHERLANQRIHWMFSPYKDQRVASLMEWVQAMNHALATVGVSSLNHSHSHSSIPQFSKLFPSSYRFTIFYKPSRGVLFSPMLIFVTGNSPANQLLTG